MQVFPCSSKHDRYFTKKAQTNHIKFWINLWMMQWKQIKFAVASLQLCGYDTGCSVPFPLWCHMSSGSINDFGWTHTHTHILGNLNFQILCHVGCGLLPNLWPWCCNFQWMLPELSDGQCEVHVLSTKVSANTRAVKWNLFYNFKYNRSH